MIVVIKDIDIAQNVYDAFVSVYGLYTFERSVDFYVEESIANKSVMMTLVGNSHLLEGVQVRNLIDVLKILTTETSNNLIIDSCFVWDSSVLDMVVELDFDVNYDNETEFLIRRIKAFADID